MDWLTKQTFTLYFANRTFLPGSFLAFLAVILLLSSQILFFFYCRSQVCSELSVYMLGFVFLLFKTPTVALDTFKKKSTEHIECIQELFSIFYRCWLKSVVNLSGQFISSASPPCLQPKSCRCCRCRNEKVEKLDNPLMEQSPHCQSKL